ncbi:hypothetical protein ACGFMM_05420 [Streptomyces sp. NPDC048604]|uniref:hypothetical protein n=1 Tax=Streptomyces sp. NPDC048604 TaxID=3365578 RepID=UPI00371710AE
MTKLLLSLHVLAAILAIGPVAVAASMFPRYGAAAPAGGGDGTAGILHRICRGYTYVGVAVPVFGIATAGQMGVLTDAWLLASIVLTIAAAVLLLAVILPGQERLLDDRDAGADRRSGLVKRLHMTTGIFNLLWAVVVVLMIVRPGSTTGA